MNDDNDSIVYAINELQSVMERMAKSQAEFQGRVMETLKEIAATIHVASLDYSVTQKLDDLISDVSLIADRYRPIGDD